MQKPGKRGASMQDVVQLRQSAIEKLNRLPREKLIEVLDFIEFITLRLREREALAEALPAPNAFVECAGTWEFEPGEQEEILQDIEQSRLMELDEQIDGLLD
jgi:hypothetical protein